MNGIPPIERNRIKSINFNMEECHSLLNDVYEDLVDREYSPLKTKINALIKKLKSVGDSVTDEV
jgi:hypothetical protein|tara:strand:- start:1139 stop:1330 length:192 start_codon:yes stop_codon:yes gene_type:complete